MTSKINFMTKIQINEEIYNIQCNICSIYKKLVISLLIIFAFFIENLILLEDVYAIEFGQFSVEILPTCEVGNDLNRLFLPSRNKGATVSDDFTLLCDSSTGAELSISTKNGGMIHSRVKSFLLGYTAVISSDILVPLRNVPLYLRATGSPSPNSGAIARATLTPLQPALVRPHSPNAIISVTLDDYARFSGSYRDVLEINIRAN